MKNVTPVTGCLLALPFVKSPTVLFLPQVRYVWGNFLLKLLLVEAYGNKVQQICLVVVGLGSLL